MCYSLTLMGKSQLIMSLTQPEKISKRCYKDTVLSFVDKDFISNDKQQRTRCY